MNATVQSLPSFRSLLRADITIQRAVKFCIAGPIVAAGMQWASQPLDSNPNPVRDEFDVAMEYWVTAGGLVLFALGFLILARRYWLVRKILTHGDCIPAMVDDIDVVAVTAESSNSAIRRTVGYSYYAEISYAWRGEQRQVRLKLPNSGFTFGLAKNHETQVLLLDSKPNQPLIRSVYLA